MMTATADDTARETLERDITEALSRLKLARARGADEEVVVAVADDIPSACGGATRDAAFAHWDRATSLRSTPATCTPADMGDFVTEELQAPRAEVVIVDGLLGLSDLTQLIVDDRPDLLFTPYTPRFPERILDFGGENERVHRHESLHAVTVEKSH
jgi:polyphosphate kinase